MLIFLGPLLAKLAIASGHSIMQILADRPAMILQEFGNLGTLATGAEGVLSSAPVPRAGEQRPRRPNSRPP